jgi:hypothetical protein
MVSQIHLEFVKLAEVMQSKGLKILKNIQTRWINILSPAVRVMNEYMVLLVKMSMDSKTPQKDNQGKKAKTDEKSLRRTLAISQTFKFCWGSRGCCPCFDCPLSHAVRTRA